MNLKSVVESFKSWNRLNHSGDSVAVAFLLSKFDMTLAEQWVADEFAIKPEAAR